MQRGRTVQVSFCGHSSTVPQFFQYTSNRRRSEVQSQIRNLTTVPPDSILKASSREKGLFNVLCNPTRTYAGINGAAVFLPRPRGLGTGPRYLVYFCATEHFHNMIYPRVDEYRLPPIHDARYICPAQLTLNAFFCAHIHICVYLYNIPPFSLHPASPLRSHTSHLPPHTMVSSLVPFFFGIILYSSLPFILFEPQSHEPKLPSPAPPPPPHLESVVVTFPPDTPKELVEDCIAYIRVRGGEVGFVYCKSILCLLYVVGGLG
jgi:hypothetical protein